jgi:hypothetical protein
MRRSTATAWTIVLLLLLLPVWSAPQAPYPPSTVLTNITWDHARAAIHQAQGSDLWPFAWAGNDSLYTAWGDGGGANGDNIKCRTSFGVHGVSGSPPNFTFSNIWGCKADGTGCDTTSGATHDPACNASFGAMLQSVGVPDGLVAVGDMQQNTLYTFISVPSGGPAHSRVMSSTTGGQSWTEATWTFPHQPGDFWPGPFVQYGAGYAGGPAGYLYVVGGKAGNGTSLYLARVPQASVLTQGAWQWFTGTPSAPAWGTWANAVPIFTDYDTPYTPVVGEGTGGTMQYFPVFNRYLLIHSYGSVQQMHVYDAPNPWGPWTTVYHNNTWGGYGTTRALLWHVISKFISADNRTFWVAFSGWSTPVNFDNLNLIKGTFTVAAAATPPPGGVVVVPQPPTMRTLTVMKQVTGERHGHRTGHRVWR